MYAQNVDILNITCVPDLAKRIVTGLAQLYDLQVIVAGHANFMVSAVPRMSQACQSCHCW